MRDKGLKRVVALMLTLALIMGMNPSIFAATKFTDTKGNWAESAIEKSVSRGIVSGYSDGSFRPEQPVTRAEFCKMFNIALGATNMGTASFNDVRSSDWFYNEVRKAVAIGYIAGYSDNTFKPKGNITRQEAATIVSRVTPGSSATMNLYSFKDSAQIADWARAGVANLFTKGYISGNSSNNFRPKDLLTRAEACDLLIHFVEGESIVSTDYVISKDGENISKKIFLNNVTISESVDDGEVSLFNVLILGSLTVKGGGKNSVNILDSTIKTMNVEKQKGDVHVILSGSTTVDKAIVSNGANIEQKSMTSDGIKELQLNGRSLSDQEVTLNGPFYKVLVDSQANLLLDSGRIYELTIGSSASGSIVNLNSGTNINSAVVNAQSDFYGSGKITEMKAGANGITYEEKPTSVLKNSSVKTPPELRDTQGIEFTPNNGKTGVELDAIITIEFDDTVYLEGGDDIYDSDIEDIIEVREGSLSGSKIDFDAEINGDSDEITIVPEDDLEPNTYYYVIILEDEIEDEDEDTFDEISIRFKTGEGSSSNSDVEFSPENNETDVDVDTEITIEFEDAICLDGGDEIEDSDIDDFVELRKGSKTGSKVDFDAEINSRSDEITITPEDDLKEDTYYYIIILEDEIEDEDGNSIDEIVSKFKTSDDSDDNEYDIDFDPTDDEEDVDVDTDITIDFGEQMYLEGGDTIDDSDIEDIIELRRGSKSGSKVGFEGEISSNEEVITITPDDDLEEDTDYYIIILDDTVENEDGDVYDEVVSSFTTEGSRSSDIDIDFDPDDGDDDVDVDTDITIDFSLSIYLEDGDEIEDSDIEDFIELREGSKTGSKIDFDAEINSRFDRITLTPDDDLEEDEDYYIIILGGEIEDEDGHEIDKTTSMFTTED